MEKLNCAACHGELEVRQQGGHLFVIPCSTCIVAAQRKAYERGRDEEFLDFMREEKYPLV